MCLHPLCLPHSPRLPTLLAPLPTPPAAAEQDSTYVGAYVPYTALCEGTDFVRNHATPSIDFATVHLW